MDEGKTPPGYALTGEPEIHNGKDENQGEVHPPDVQFVAVTSDRTEVDANISVVAPGLATAQFLGTLCVFFIIQIMSIISLSVPRSNCAYAMIFFILAFLLASYSILKSRTNAGNFAFLYLRD